MATEVAGLPRDQHDFGMSKGHSPVADKVVCVDFDGTIVPWGPLMGAKTPFDGVAAALHSLKVRGYRIVILTSRLSERWAKSVIGSENKFEVGRFLAEQHEYVATTLDYWCIPWDEITAEKVPAEAYFDDKAYRCDTANLGLAVAYFLLIESAERAA